jgi:RHS repeat-associated protein
LGVQYNALNGPTQYTLGSGTTATARYTYYGLDGTGWPFGAVKTIQLQQGSNPMLVNREMTYDAGGNVTAINDFVNSESISYTYDDLNRLLTAGTPLNETYAYDTIGNITSKNGSSYTYDDTHKHAVASFNGASYTYDANGAMITRNGGQSIKYSQDHLPSSVSTTAGTLCRFVYDGDGGRRKRLDNQGTIHYVSGGYERNVGTGANPTEVITKHYCVSLGVLVKTVAIRRGGALYYIGTDHLGGTIRSADASFTAVDGMRYKPYGESRDTGSNLQTDHKFTGQIEDGSIGLYWYSSRAYDATLSRFTCPDSLIPNTRNPQSLNRYSYVLNNPLKYKDPTGHRLIKDDITEPPSAVGDDAQSASYVPSAVYAKTVIDAAWEAEQWAAVNARAAADAAWQAELEAAAVVDAQAAADAEKQKFTKRRLQAEIRIKIIDGHKMYAVIIGDYISKERAEENKSIVKQICNCEPMLFKK